MEADHKPLLLLALLTLLMTKSTHTQLLPIVDEREGATPGRIQTYIVHVARPEGAAELLGDQELEAWHASFLPNTTLDSGEPRLVYSYRHAVSGFAARLTPEEAEAMEAMDGFVRAEPDQEHELETTYTPKFLGLVQSQGLWRNSSYGAGIVIGVIDSGVPGNPHPSFGDGGMAAPPVQWNGRCNRAVFSGCNNKIIRAVGFIGGVRTDAPNDTTGHGSHVASIAAGNFVNASVNGFANGVASGVAPKAYLAIYKVCNNVTCLGTDILAGVDQAVKDGVNVVTMSLGDLPTAKFFNDACARGALAAVNHNISAVASAGNRGCPQSLSHSAPWLVAVGASTTDRKTGPNVQNGTQYGVRPAPTVATFSSRGPSLTNGGILKPDLLAPGVEILGAWHKNVGGKPFQFNSGTSMAAPHVAGTMALLKKVYPQWSPAAIQSAIITSAGGRDLNGNLIVDAKDNTTAGIFATGAGQLNPSGAMDPGLVYDLKPKDYIGYLCGLGYTDSEVTSTVGGPQTRCSAVRAIAPPQLNYPSITVILGSSSRQQTVQRTVTNVGPANSAYQARPVAPPGVRVQLSATQLRFTRVGESRQFNVTLSVSTSLTPGLWLPPARGKLEWVSVTHKHVVTTPIAVIFTPTT